MTQPFVAFRVPKNVTTAEIATLYRMAAGTRELVLTLPTGAGEPYVIADLEHFPHHDIRIDETTWAVRYE